MKLIISTIVAGFVLFLLGWVFYGMLFMEYLSKNYAGMQRSPEDMKLWAIALSCLFQGFFMSYIYRKMYKGGSPFFEGLKFGIIIGMFMAVPYIFSAWATMPITYQTAIVDGIIMGLMIGITGIVIGLMYGRIGTDKISSNDTKVTAGATA